MITTVCVFEVKTLYMDVREPQIFCLLLWHLHFERVHPSPAQVMQVILEFCHLACCYDMGEIETIWSW
jgi:hypothetical protein